MIRALLIACALAACATFAPSYLVRRDAPVTLLPNEGLVALSVRGARASLALCRDADLAQCIELGPVDDDVVVARVHEGAHCVRQIAFELSGGRGVVRAYDAHEAACVDIEAGAVNDLGVLDVHTRETQTALVFVRSAFVAREPARASVGDAYPHLAGIAVRSAPPVVVQRNP